MYASLNDYIIKGVNGEFYPCKPDIFDKTYEEVTVTIIDMEDSQKENDHSLKECYENLISIMVDMSLLCGKALFEK